MTHFLYNSRVFDFITANYKTIGGSELFSRVDKVPGCGEKATFIDKGGIPPRPTQRFLTTSNNSYKIVDAREK